MDAKFGHDSQQQPGHFELREHPAGAGDLGPVLVSAPEGQDDDHHGEDLFGPLPPRLFYLFLRPVFLRLGFGGRCELAFNATRHPHPGHNLFNPRSGAVSSRLLAIWADGGSSRPESARRSRLVQKRAWAT